MPLKALNGDKSITVNFYIKNPEIQYLNIQKVFTDYGDECSKRNSSSLNAEIIELLKVITE
jgi:hypothetical protein